ncbi:biotin transporter BioY [Tindallia californiensis]|uniref:Biotin transporter n=1 Tax=Tindallia californiensis TaxID=159292 RepID=A0A1H3IQD3_9FIRM|nr:biotin transporter BioY [Tindallia californiensis]SDY29525.1 biotin transport system substrate-specific component [Tindallia californiensis]
MRLKTREVTLISMFTALTAIGAFIKIPTPVVPFTLQFLFCAYAGIFLGAKHGLYSQLLYVGIGLVGIPIFANGGGPAYLLQPTFGYLIGFIMCAFIIGKRTESLEEISFLNVLTPVLTGLFFVYLIGVSYLYMIVNLYVGRQMSVVEALMVGFMPYIAPDLILSGVIAFTAVTVVPVLRRSGLVKSIKQ